MIFKMIPRLADDIFPYPSPAGEGVRREAHDGWGALGKAMLNFPLRLLRNHLPLQGEEMTIATLYSSVIASEREAIQLMAQEGSGLLRRHAPRNDGLEAVTNSGGRRK